MQICNVIFKEDLQKVAIPQKCEKQSCLMLGTWEHGDRRQKISQHMWIVATIKKSPTKNQTSCVPCHVSCVTCPLSIVTCNLSSETCHWSRLTFYLSPVTCHMSPTPTATTTVHTPANSLTLHTVHTV